jgi:hypothetical protein
MGSAIQTTEAAAAQPAHGAPLEQRRPLARRTMIETPGERLGVVAEALLLALVLVPAGIAGMVLLDERVPLALGQDLGGDVSVRLLAVAPAPVYVGAGVPGTVQGAGGVIGTPPHAGARSC